MSEETKTASAESLDPAHTDSAETIVRANEFMG